MNKQQAKQIIWDRCQHNKDTEEALKFLVNSADSLDVIIYLERLIREYEELRNKVPSADEVFNCGYLWGIDTVTEFLKVKQFELKAGETRSPIGHKHEIIRMLRKDTECPYSACAKAYEKALNYLRYGGEEE